LTNVRIKNLERFRSPDFLQLSHVNSPLVEPAEHLMRDKAMNAKHFYKKPSRDLARNCPKFSRLMGGQFVRAISCLMLNEEFNKRFQISGNQLSRDCKEAVSLPAFEFGQFRLLTRAALLRRCTRRGRRWQRHLRRAPSLPASAFLIFNL
jgi:hypothetical protein